MIELKLAKTGTAIDEIRESCGCDCFGSPSWWRTVAFEVAKALGVPLDVFVLRKLGVPGHEELAFGAIGSGGVRVLDSEIVKGWDCPTSLSSELPQQKNKN